MATPTPPPPPPTTTTRPTATTTGENNAHLDLLFSKADDLHEHREYEKEYNLLQQHVKESPMEEGEVLWRLGRAATYLSKTEHESMELFERAEQASPGICDRNASRLKAKDFLAEFLKNRMCESVKKRAKMSN